MKNKMCTRLALLFFCVSFLTITTHAQDNTLGIFDGQGDIGPVKHTGSGTYDGKMQQYQLQGSGTNV